MTSRSTRLDLVAQLWEDARAGDFRRASSGARDALAVLHANRTPAKRAELHLVLAFCSMRQGRHSDALRELEKAKVAASSCSTNSRLGLRIETWNAELAYFQGRYSDADRIIDSLLPRLERRNDRAYLAFALRIRIAICLARADYDGASALADRAISVAEASGDAYVLVQILNVLGAVHFDRATAKLGQPHARAHLSSLDPRDARPMEADARDALRFFERARLEAESASYAFAAWYVAGNIERIEILLGHADRAIRPMRQRLAKLQARGATYDEIVIRSNLAWGLRTLGRYRDALHELDVALDLARHTGTGNVLLEFLEYDRSIVLDALGDPVATRASYRRYVQIVSARNRTAPQSAIDKAATSSRHPLEPYFLKRADRFIGEHLGEAFSVSDLARHCGISWRTLQQAFNTFRGLTAVAHVRNVRLDAAHGALAETPAPISEVAAKCGFRSVTTFALEYRKRFGITPSQTARTVRSDRFDPDKHAQSSFR
jgi:AraC-like DNA-binding protein/tetratricopeptide (TPR) repeat protein